tara:strand:+ start:306 stop:539 length:234 start_codon:yes stop_codon:yes gene_type:complete
MELTPLEEAIINAQEIAAGLALTAMVQNLVKENAEASVRSINHELCLSERREAIKEERHTNQLLAIVALTGNLEVSA